MTGAKAALALSIMLVLSLAADGLLTVVGL